MATVQYSNPANELSIYPHDYNGVDMLARGQRATNRLGDTAHGMGNTVWMYVQAAAALPAGACTVNVATFAAAAGAGWVNPADFAAGDYGWVYKTPFVS